MRRFRGRIRRLEREAEGDGFIVRLQDGSSKVFETMEIQMQMFLANVDLFTKESVHNDVVDAVRQATPESRAQFEERFGSITPTGHVISRPEDGWVDEYTLTETGEVKVVRFPAGSEEVERIRNEVRHKAQL